MALDEENLSVAADASDGFEEPVVWRQNPGEDIAPAADQVARELAAQGQALNEEPQAWNGVPAWEPEGSADAPAPEPQDAGVVARETSRFGLLGHPLGHSWSPQIHSLLGSTPYSLFDKDEAQARDFLAQGSWQGLNVTIPYKRLAFSVADERSAAVEATGAANTLVRLDDGRILAENTDVWGFQWMLDRFCRNRLGAEARGLFAGQKALVLGSGGAASAVRWVLEQAGCSVVTVSRRGPVTYDDLADHADAALVVNATPVGMFPQCPSSPLDLGQLRQLSGLRAVLDVVYNPERSGLVLLAERLHLPASGGLPMLVAQAFASSQLFQGRQLSNDLLERALASVQRQTRNVFFIGMPGCGKTGAARRMAHQCQRPFVDLDDAFEMQTGVTAAQFIETRGEDAFRDQESQVLADYGKQSGLVVACGGGVVVRDRNYGLMRQNGVIVFLDRPLDQLSTQDRPLTASRGVEALAQERMPLYRSWADLEVACTGSAEGDAVLVRQLLHL